MPVLLQFGLGPHGKGKKESTPQSYFCINNKKLAFVKVKLQFLRKLNFVHIITF